VTPRVRYLGGVTHETNLEKRIVDLELRFMKSEKLIDELNDVIVAQQRELDRLAGEVKSLREQLLSGVDAPINERPPHY
jgi:SlyX protein